MSTAGFEPQSQQASVRITTEIGQIHLLTGGNENDGDCELQAYGFDDTAYEYTPAAFNSKTLLQRAIFRPSIFH